MESYTSIFLVCAIVTISAHVACAQPGTSERPPLGTNAGPMDAEEDERAAAAAAEALAELRAHPIDINSASVDDLLAIPFLSPAVAHRIVVRRDTHGVYHAIRELREIPGMDRRLYASIVPYVTVLQTASAVVLRSRVSVVPEVQAGFRTGVYGGDRLHVYDRIDAYWQQFEGHLVAEKDAGERSVLDRGVVSLSYRDKSAGLTFIAGDYDIGLGQGLLFWKSVASGKGAEVIRGPRRAAFGVSPSHSAIEYGGFRGGAIAWEGEGGAAAAFFSNGKRDASLAADGSFTTLQSSGLHRTSAELASRNMVGERVLGGHAALRWGGGEVGVTAAVCTFDHDWLSDAGRIHSAGGGAIDWHATIPGGETFGECAGDGRGHAGVVAGASTAIGERFECSAMYRRYPRRFAGMHVNAFGEHASGENEEGIYVGARYKLADAISMSAYYDLFAFPFPTGSLQLPTHGSESLLAVDVPCTKTVMVRGLATWKQSPLSVEHIDSLGNVEARIAAAWRRRERGEIVYDNGLARFRGRVELVQYRKSDEHPIVHGALLVVDAGCRVGRAWALNGRIAVFQTTNYDARVYEYEDGLDGVSAVPGLYGAGSRSYLCASYRPIETLTLELKWSETYKPLESSTGTGAEEIEGSFVHLVEAQMTWKFGD